MANNLKTSIAARNAALNAIAALANGGLLKIYDGAQPATPETGITTQNLLSTLTLNAAAFAAAAAGVLTANAITQDSDIAATGTASWYRLYKSDGVTVLWDGSVGSASADLILNSVNLVQHAILQATSLTYTLPQ